MADADRARRSQRPSPSPKLPKEKPRNAAEAQKAMLDKLFVDPNREVVLPGPPKARGVAPPREMIPNVQGSSAGAGSGEFHVYKQSRRREYERLKAMDEEDAKERAAREFAEKQEAMRLEDESKTAKNRAKRQKKKEKRKTKGKGSGTAAAGPGKGKTAGAAAAEGSSDSDDSDDEGEGKPKKRKLANGAPGAVVFRGRDEREQDDDQPREEEIVVKRIEEALSAPGNASNGDAQDPAASVSEYQGILIVDED